MNRFKTYGLGALCGVGVLATLDSALGLGGGALLADICRTFLEDEPAGGEGMGGMAGMSMEVKPVPLIALSLAATTAAIWALAQDHQKVVTGRSEPDDEERSAILSAMLIVATAQGRTTRDEMADVFRIVTSHDLEDDLLEAAYTRFHDMQADPARSYRMPEVRTSIGRRRVLAAALIVGCVARQSTEHMSGLIAQLAADIGATSEDITAARDSLAEWQSDHTPVRGVSPVSVLRHRSLQLSPA